ncbi:MAG TPA: DUF488 family protein [Acidimicrobiales bacterium]
MKVETARVYDDLGNRATRAVLVDRLWPRGLAKAHAPFSIWMKDIAPSTELRKWYGHAPERFEEFARRYREELGQSPAREALEDLRAQAGENDITLVTATKQVDLSAAAVLREILART